MMLNSLLLFCNQCILQYSTHKAEEQSYSWFENQHLFSEMKTKAHHGPLDTVAQLSQLVICENVCLWELLICSQWSIYPKSLCFSGNVLLRTRPEKALVVQWENKCARVLVQYVNCLTSVFGLSLWEHLQQLPYKFPVLRKQEQKVPFLSNWNVDFF